MSYQNHIWNVKAIILGHHLLDKSGLTHAVDAGKVIQIPLIAVALDDGQHKILVDTGQHDAKWVSEHMLPATTEKEEEIDAALKIAMGWNVDDVDIVINTHLHFDHCGNNSLFRKSKFIVSKKEWEYAFHPLEHQKRLFLPELFDSRAVNYFQWEFIEGDVDLFPGLTLIETPGHSGGHYSVLVNTNQGVLCIAGDVCGTVQNLNENIVSDIVVSPGDMLLSYRKIRMCADRVIPGHEALIKPFQSEDFPVVDKNYNF